MPRSSSIQYYLAVQDYFKCVAPSRFMNSGCAFLSSCGFESHCLVIIPTLIYSCACFSFLFFCAPTPRWKIPACPMMKASPLYTTPFALATTTLSSSCWTLESTSTLPTATDGQCLDSASGPAAGGTAGGINAIQWQRCLEMQEIKTFFFALTQQD